MAFILESKIIEANLKQITNQLICNEKFLDDFGVFGTMQHNEINTIKNEIEGKQRSSLFMQTFLETLNKDSVLAFIAALRLSEQQGLYDMLMNSDQILIADETDTQKYAIKPVTLSGPKIPEKYPFGKAYKLSKESRGQCLIININKFSTDPPTERLGSKVDTDNLVKVFRELNFEVTEASDLNAKEIIEEVENFVSAVRKLPHHECGMISLVLMSHGTREGFIQGKDCNPVNRYDLFRKVYSCKELKGRPKLFVVQACAGGDRIDAKKDDTAETYGIDRTLESPQDTLIITSAFEGFVSWRSEKYGSLFVIFLAQVLADHSHELDLEEICKLVQIKTREHAPIKALNKDNQCVEDYCIPLPGYFIFLQKKLYLLPSLEVPSTLQNKVFLCHPSRESDLGDTTQSDEVTEELLYNYEEPCVIIEPKACQDVLKYSPDNELVYWMGKEKRGRCLIINISKFENSYYDRPGSVQDAKQLKALFEKLDFDVQYQEKSLTHKEIEDAVMADLVLDLDRYAMYVLVLMSIGLKQSCIFDTNFEPVDQHELRMKICNCEDLKGKPKFFIVDAGAAGEFTGLRGRNYKTKKHRLLEDDVLILDSCFDGLGYQTVDGDRSLFIRILVYLLYHHSHEWHLEEICKKVQDEMMKFCKEKVDRPVQMACYAFFLQKMLFLFPGLELNACQQQDDVTENEDVTATTVAMINKEESRRKSTYEYDMKDEPGSSFRTGDEWKQVVEGANGFLCVPGCTDVEYPEKRLKLLPEVNTYAMEGPDD